MIKRTMGALLLLLLCVFMMIACGGESVLETIEWQSLTWGVGAPLPQAADFAVSLPQGVNVKYAQDYSFVKTGMYQLELIVTDQNGNELRKSVSFNLVIDHEAPTLTGVKDLVTYVGEGLAYKSGVTVRDNCGGRVTLEVDSSAVNIHAAGEYPVIYRATDAAGNVNMLTVTAYVYEARVTEADLYTLLDPIIARVVPAGASKEAQVRAIYNYVHEFQYVASSDKSDWVRAAYDGLRTQKGDCYTYFAVSKAFFVRLGIENMDVKRTEGIVDERHYWNYVNVGSPEAPRWYHYDATRIREAQHSGCLLTDQQINAFHKMRVDENGVGNYFYAYDRSLYPASDTTIITSTKVLEPYYG